MEGNNNFYGVVNINAGAGGHRRSRRTRRAQGLGGPWLANNAQIQPQRGGRGGQQRPYQAQRGAAFGRGGYRGQQAAAYQPPARGNGFGRGGMQRGNFGRGNVDRGNRGNRGGFAGRADRGMLGQRGLLFGRARGNANVNQGNWAQPQQVANPWGPAAPPPLQAAQNVFQAPAHDM